MTKQNNNTKKSKGLPLTGIMGVATLFVVVSIAYSTFVVATGTDGLAPKLMLVPQALFASVVLVRKFSN